MSLKSKNINLASDNLSNNAIIRIDKPQIVLAWKHIIQNVGITDEDKEKIINSLLSDDRLIELISNSSNNLDVGTKKVFIDSTIALASTFEEDYEEKNKLLQNILTKKLENPSNQRNHYLTLQTIEVIKKISSDEIKLLALMVFFISCSPREAATQNQIEDYVNRFIEKIDLDNFMNKTINIGNWILQSLHINGLIIKQIPNTIWNTNSIDKLKKWFFCETEDELNKKINEQLIISLKNIGEVTELGNFFGIQILHNLGFDIR